MSDSQTREDSDGALALQALLEALRLHFLCSICHGHMRVPVCLPCGHTFCSECIRRTLCTISRCPIPHCGKPSTTSALRSVRVLESVANLLRPRPNTSAQENPNEERNQQTRSHMVLLTRTTASRSAVAHSLECAGLSTSGTLDELLRRHKEFVVRWNANLDSQYPVSDEIIAQGVRRWEAALKKRDKEASNKTQAFARPVGNIRDMVSTLAGSSEGHGRMAGQKRPIQALEGEIPSSPEDLATLTQTQPRNENELAPGDGHETQIRKLRGRMGFPPEGKPRSSTIGDESSQELPNVNMREASIDSVATEEHVANEGEGFVQDPNTVAATSPARTSVPAPKSEAVPVPVPPSIAETSVQSAATMVAPAPFSPGRPQHRGRPGPAMSGVQIPANQVPVVLRPATTQSHFHPELPNHDASQPAPLQNASSRGAARGPTAYSGFLRTDAQMRHDPGFSPVILPTNSLSPVHVRAVRRVIHISPERRAIIARNRSQAEAKLRAKQGIR